MLKNVHVFIIFFHISQQICQSSTKTIPHTTKDQLKVSTDSGEHQNPTTSYHRYNLFGPNTYAFGFEVNDKATGNKQFRDERRYANGSVQGSYGYVRPDGSVMVTHFLADAERGYLSQTQNFEPGDEAKWQANWPTKKPSIFMDSPPAAAIQPAVFYNDNEKLNLTSILLPVEAIQKEHGIDLNPTDLEKEFVNPAALEIINGQTPLKHNGNGKTENNLGFETVNKFIPSDFPIIPFELPQDDLESDHQNKSEMKMNETLASNKYNERKINNSEKAINPILPLDKYEKSKENNSEKSIPLETLKLSQIKENDDGENLKNVPKVKSLMMAGTDNAWYDKVIEQTRQKYLENLKGY